MFEAYNKHILIVGYRFDGMTGISIYVRSKDTDKNGIVLAKIKDALSSIKPDWAWDPIHTSEADVFAFYGATYEEATKLLLQIPEVLFDAPLVFVKDSLPTYSDEDDRLI